MRPASPPALGRVEQRFVKRVVERGHQAAPAAASNVDDESEVLKLMTKPPVQNDPAKRFSAAHDSRAAARAVAQFCAVARAGRRVDWHFTGGAVRMVATRQSMPRIASPRGEGGAQAGARDDAAQGATTRLGCTASTFQDARRRLLLRRVHQLSAFCVTTSFTTYITHPWSPAQSSHDIDGMSPGLNLILAEAVMTLPDGAEVARGSGTFMPHPKFALVTIAMYADEGEYPFDEEDSVL